MSKSGSPYLAVSDNGQIVYEALSSKTLPGALEIMNTVFFHHENVCKAVDLENHPEAIEELQDLVMRVARDGISIVALHKESSKVVGVVFNKIHTKDNQEEVDYFQNFIKRCKYPHTKVILEFLVLADNLVDIFEVAQVDSIMDIMFMATSPVHRGSGIGKTLMKLSVDSAKIMKQGGNVRVPIDGKELKEWKGEPLKVEHPPQAVVSIFTSFITQKIGKELGFVVAREKSYEELEFQGKTYASVIGDHTPVFTLEYLKLD